MCGLAGFVHPAHQRGDALAAELDSMLAALRHRGPDDQGQWLEGSVALGHRRLSIVDLSPLGHQPMTSPSGRYVIAYNGEIYNHAALRSKLEASGVTFRGHSDTEVLVALVESMGLVAALEQCIGMFAIALWDRETATLQLARDRLGEKPLVYGWSQGHFLFGSELGALRAHSAFRAAPDPVAIAALLQLGYVPAPLSLHAGFRKVAPGTVVTIECRRGAGHALDEHSCPVTIETYWSATDVLDRGLRAPYGRSFEDASRALEQLLGNAVAQQMQADVPLGAFLSGGVDSSLVVALMQRQSGHRIRTFAIGFDEPGMNEAPHAAAVAAHLGTEHTELYVGSADALAIIPKLPAMFDEPLGDASQIPTHMVARMARDHVTVALSGDGGDELFGGYRKYLMGASLDALPARRALAAALGLLPLVALERLERWALGVSGRETRLRSPRMRSLRHWLAAPTRSALAARLSLVNGDARALLGKLVDAFAWPVSASALGRASYLRQAMWLDSLHYLPDDVLTKVDRATMSVSLESRAPLLDHRVAEFAAHLPDTFLLDERGGKRILRDILYRHVPAELVDRPKQGFSVPLARWLRGELHDWARDLLQGGPRSSALLDLQACRALMDDHVAGRRDASAQLWPVLSLLGWQLNENHA